MKKVHARSRFEERQKLPMKKKVARDGLGTGGVGEKKGGWGMKVRNKPEGIAF